MAVNYGRDTSCTNTLRTGRYATGARLVAEAAYRRLITPRGSLRGSEEEQNYGLDLMDLVGSVSTKADAASLPGRIRSELTKDERITSLDVEVLRIVDGPSVAYQITIDGKCDAGPFNLTLKASEVTVELLGLSPEN